MLETGDVDDEYFTPVPSASLFTIFHKPASSHEENSSLKYTPPKLITAKPKPEEKPSECIFACAIFGYQWFNNVYISKGKLGFAVMKITQTASTEILLYDSKKSTLSCTTIQPGLEVKLKGDTYISFYDNAQKYWNIYGSVKEIQKITDVLKDLKVVVLNSPEAEEGPPAPREEETLIKITTYDNEKNTDVLKDLKVVLNSPEAEEGPPAPREEETLIKVTTYDNEVKESDTDSSVNRKTKASILNRMANMGHSVLPPQTLMIDKTSDSSDTNDTYDHHKMLRHKPHRSVVKRTQDKFTMDAPKCSPVSDTEDVTRLTLTNKELSPLTTNIISTINPSNDVNLLMSEQIINNSELHRNMGRLSDKVDLILDKVTDIKLSQSTANNFQNEILQKLLKEYENRISAYEELIKSKGLSADANIGIANKRSKEIEISKLTDQVLTLETVNEEKNSMISNLNTQLVDMQDKLLEKHNTFISEKDKLNQEIKELKQELCNKTIELSPSQKLDKVKENTTSQPDLELRIKNIMNNTFQSLSVNFENEKMYTGANVKKTVATVIKNVTLDLLKEN